MSINELVMRESYYLASSLANSINLLIIRLLCILASIRRLVPFCHVATKFGIISETEVSEFSLKEYTIFVKC